MEKSLAMVLFFGFYFIVLLVIIGVTVGVYKLVSRRGKAMAVLTSTLAFFAMVLFCPILIHGGFTFLGEILSEEIVSAMASRGRATERENRREIRKKIEGRFAGPLDFTLVEKLSGNWSQVSIKPDVETTAYYDSASGMLWSGWIEFATSGDLPSLATTKKYCQQLPPTGHWALASAVDNYLLWKSDGHKQLPSAPASTVHLIVDDFSGAEMPGYTLRRKSDNNRPGPTGSRPFALRCVAQTANTPEGGYARKDIPLREWNRFQMSNPSR